MFSINDFCFYCGLCMWNLYILFMEKLVVFIFEKF